MSAGVVRELRPLEARYRRPLLPWVRRRARRLQRVFDLPRGWAVAEAAKDFADFTGNRQVNRLAEERIARLWQRLEADS